MALVTVRNWRFCPMILANPAKGSAKCEFRSAVSSTIENRHSLFPPRRAASTR